MSRSWWFGLDHQPISAQEGDRLLADFDARRIGLDVLVVSGEPTSISTIFLVIDHQYAPDGPPLLYETLVERAGTFVKLWRYETREQAVAGHAQVVADLRAYRPTGGVA